MEDSVNHVLTASRLTWPALGCALLLACAGTTPPESQPSDAATPPDAPPARTADTPANWLVIVADDLGNDKVGAYGEHPKSPPTPHIDALASDGLLFRNAYANPVCSPSRAALLTGRYGRRTGFGAIVEIADDASELDLSEELVPEMLSRASADWTSAAIGKWHLAGYKSATNLRHPNAQGFDHYAGALGNLFYTSTERRANWRSYEKVVNGTAAWVDEYATVGTTDDAITFLGTADGPWFLYVAYNAPHTPFHVPPANLYTGRIDKKASDIEKFDASVEAMDAEIGRLLGSLTQAQRDNTYVVFVGDNGTDRGAILPPLQPEQGKVSLYEGGINVPLVVTGPGVKTGETQALVHLVDLLPTIAEATGAEPKGPIDGISFLEVLAKPSASPRDFVYVERFRPLGGGPYGLDLQTVRDDRYKIITDKQGKLSFHDLDGRHDDGPPKNPKSLKGEERKRFERLQGELKRLDKVLTYAH